MSQPVRRLTLPEGPVLAVAWQAGGNTVAVSHCGNDISIYEFKQGAADAWTKVATLRGHQQPVSGLDWSRSGDTLLSVSHDRNAFVWSKGGGGAAGGAAAGAAAEGPGGGAGAGAGAGAGWDKQMVITRLTKGALCCNWSPTGAKFAIGSAARVVSVGFFDPESSWWACKLIRKAHEAGVTSLAWHHNGCVLATGCTDRRVRLFNAYVDGYEPAAPAGALPAGSAFGDCLLEVAHEGSGWVHCLCWVPGDEALLYGSHDGVVGVVRGGKAAVEVQLPAPGLPLRCLTAVSERLAVGAGWGGGVVVLTRRGAQAQWQLAAVLGSEQGGGGGAGAGGAGGARAAAPKGGIVQQQLAQLSLAAGGGGGGAASQAGARGQQQGSSSGGHSACVTGLAVLPTTGAARPGAGGAAGPVLVASAGLDGAVLTWDVSSYA